MAEKKVICKVHRPFKHEGKIIAVGKTVELPEILALQLYAANKVSFHSGGVAEKSEAIDPLAGSPAPHKSKKGG